MKTINVGQSSRGDGDSKTTNKYALFNNESGTKRTVEQVLNGTLARTLLSTSYLNIL